LLELLRKTVAITVWIPMPEGCGILAAFSFVEPPAPRGE
jgi:hypothetical protein